MYQTQQTKATFLHMLCSRGRWDFLEVFFTCVLPIQTSGDDVTGLPKGMTQSYFDQATDENKCFGWAVVRKEGQENSLALTL